MPHPAGPSQPQTANLLTRRNFLLGASAVSAGLLLYSNEIARHELDIVQRTFFLRNLPPAFDGFRIVQFSDIHLAEFAEDFFLRRVIAHVNALRADLILITGDFVSPGPLSRRISLDASLRCAQLLSTLSCPLRFGVLGNHDAMVGSAIIRRHLTAAGIYLLVNQHLRIERNDQHLFLGGIDDFTYGTPNLFQAVPERPDAPVLLMAHEPDFANHVAAHPRGPFVDLILSGHTHGGQVRLPGLRPLDLPPLGKLYPEGFYRVGTSQLYVNRGIGTVGVPFRLNCPPEITVLTLRPEPATSPEPGALSPDHALTKP